MQLADASLVKSGAVWPPLKFDFEQCAVATAAEEIDAVFVRRDIMR
jgi:hypothetical protein